MSLYCTMSGRPDEHNTEIEAVKELTRDMLTPKQGNVLKAAKDAILEGQPSVCIGGAAGSGKTACAKFLMEEMADAGKTIYAAAPTNKAVGVLRGKLDGMDVTMGTIHRLLRMKPKEVNIEERGELAQKLEDAYKRGTSDVEKIKAKLDKMNRDSLDFNAGECEIEPDSVIFVDEASMVEDSSKAELEATGASIVYIGDPYQLPPVKGKHWFSVKPEMEFDVIHRQAAGSGILDLATEVRTGAERGASITEILENHSRTRSRDVHYKTHADLRAGGGVSKSAFQEIALNHDQAIVFRRNDPQKAPTIWKTSSLNAIYRWACGRESPYPMAGESIILTQPFYLTDDEAWYTGDRLTFAEDGSILDCAHQIKMGIAHDDKGKARMAAASTAWKAGAFRGCVVHEDGQRVNDVAIAPVMVDNAPMALAHTLLNSRPAERNPLSHTVRSEYSSVMTGHTAQGSQWDRVCAYVDAGLLDWSDRQGVKQGRPRGGAHKWLYTVVSRAAKSLTIVMI